MMSPSSQRTSTVILSLEVRHPPYTTTQHDELIAERELSRASYAVTARRLPRSGLAAFHRPTAAIIALGP